MRILGVLFVGFLVLTVLGVLGSTDYEYESERNAERVEKERIENFKKTHPNRIFYPNQVNNRKDQGFYWTPVVFRISCSDQYLSFSPGKFCPPRHELPVPYREMNIELDSSGQTITLLVEESACRHTGDPGRFMRFQTNNLPTELLDKLKSAQQEISVSVPSLGAPFVFAVTEGFPIVGCK